MKANEIPEYFKSQLSIMSEMGLIFIAVCLLWLFLVG